MEIELDSWKSLAIRSLVVALLLVLFIGVIGYLSRVVLLEFFEESDILPNIIVTIVLIVSTLTIVAVSNKLLIILEDYESLTPHQKEISYRFIQFTTYMALALIIVAYVWEINLSNILLGAGLLSVILGFATRKILGSVFSGIIIMTTNMFKVGEWIKFGDKFGRIQEINFFHTKILSPQGEEHIIPNDQITSNDVTNISHNRYRNDILIGISYDTDIERAIDVCNSTLRELSDEDNNYIAGFQPTTVKDFDASEIELSVKVWLDAPTPNIINKAQTTVFSEIQRAFDENDIDIPFPQRTVHNINSEDTG